MVRDNLNNVCSRIKESAARSGRNHKDITLVCVVKEADIESVREALRSGARDIGENTVQAACAKYKLLSGEKSHIRWHFIGHLQTNKVKNAVRMFDLIHSVDSIRLAEAIQKEAEKIGKTQDVLLEVNVSGEKSKYGFAPEDINDAAAAVSGMKNLTLAGLMTIAPYSEDPELSRQYFRRLRELRDGLIARSRGNIKIRHLSMGMSADFEIAVEEGADIVRIGAAIFRRPRAAAGCPKRV